MFQLYTSHDLILLFTQNIMEHTVAINLKSMYSICNVKIGKVPVSRMRSATKADMSKCTDWQKQATIVVHSVTQTSTYMEFHKRIDAVFGYLPRGN